MFTNVLKENSTTSQTRKMAGPLFQKNCLETIKRRKQRFQTSNLVLKCLEENGFSQTFKDLLSSLPKAKGWLSPHLYKYQGFWLTALHLHGTLSFQHCFQAQDSDILLITSPKSGTIWLKAMVFTLINRMSHPILSQEHPLLTINPHDLVPFLELNYAQEKNPISPNSSLTSPGLYSTHLPYVSLPESVKNTKCKIIYMCRNPRDTFVSLWHYISKLRSQDSKMIPFEEAFDMFCNGLTMAGPFWDHVLSYWEKSLEMPQKVFFLKYEEVKEQPCLHLKCLAEFLERPFSLEEEESGLMNEIIKLCSFENLSNLEVNKSGKTVFGNDNRVFFRKGEVGDWKNHLTTEMVDRLNQITEDKFNGSDFRRVTSIDDTRHQFL
ncbi:cytosolic sulfotransferase 12-like isoform X2 [Nicotiana tabacum]|uniref:Cytosolic sulfotransferase 12-like isoform X2 n=1 Tax=Nicotiana tabacum TaxID=4097 RepID=A0AC58UGD7_TOBAC